MATIKKFSPGEFCWADLGTTDVPSAKKFYASLFGWKAFEVPMHGDAMYSMMELAGKHVCAIYPMMPEQRRGGRPPAWLPFISVANIKQAVKKATKAGGKLCMGPAEVTESGKMAVLQDPTGATFAIWQAGTHKGTQVKEVPGAVCWHDLSTHDRSAAGKFYGKVFGWKMQTQDFSGNLYTLFKLGRKGVGGMWPQPMPDQPAGWFTYWVVENCARAVTKAKRRGGKVLMGPITVPKTCRFAIIQDPQGAAFGALEPLI